MATKKQKQQYYLGKETLPTPDAVFDYGSNPEWAQDLIKCKRNILYFAENFFYITNLDQGKIKIPLHNYQKRVLRGLRDNRFVVLLSSRQSGKALALDTPISTPLGWTTMGELKQGDQVYGADGTPCNVVYAHDVLENRKCYKVIFDNGEEIIADADHLWYTESRNERKTGGTIKTTQQLVNTLHAPYGVEPNHRIPTCINGLSGSLKELPIDPYVFGLWLGDGASAGGTMTVGKRDINDIVDILNTQQKQFDKLILHEYKKEVYTLRITSSKNLHTESLAGILKHNNLINNKHIPCNYMLSSREQRLALLQGLMDSDGYIDVNGSACFYNTDLNLAKQVKELIESLGYKATYKEFVPKLRGVECSICAIINFKPIEFVCRLSFKRNRIKIKPLEVQSHLRAQWHYIKNIQEVESVPVRCITVDSKDNLYLAGKQLIPTHNTTMFTIYALWIACFQEDQRILIVANKEQTAINIFKRVRMAYEQLPNYLKPGVEEYGKTGMTLANGSSIGISTTSSDAGRGDSVNILLLDELAFIDNHMVEEFWASVYPIISSSKKSKIFVASTPNGTDNLFYQLYDGALETDPEKHNGWRAERVDWWEIPGRDEKWKNDTIRSLGSRETFDQEYGNVFIQSGESAVSEEFFEKLKADCQEPKFVFDDGHYLLWQEPSKERLYAVGVDISEGVGEAASVIQVLDITNLQNIEQVATYHNRNISPYNFTTKLKEILEHWGNPPALVERNNCGAQVVDQLKLSLGYENIVNYGSRAGDKVFNKPGMVAHTNTKYKGVMNMRYWFNELNVVRLRDLKTLSEMRNFVRYPNGTWAAKANNHDDRVMSLMWTLMILENEITEKYFEILELDDHKRPKSIKSLDYGIKYFVNPTSIYSNERATDDMSGPMPIIMDGFGAGNDKDQGIVDLEEQGWSFLNNTSSTGSFF